ncbi:unnamed protein product [Rotaria socialis]|uniref:Uncharacterized protein n=1 Tax=Rotaria socialis TaxID=392032 RepID=A0A820LMC5_9BILA|nr:unnamed protein product [Rotaria socialis]CAF4359685.1 unnamed protein product [Rotaria socialis]
MASNKQSNYIRKERIPVSSAIPSAKLGLSSLPRRPAPAQPSGQSESLLTNHFPCGFEKNLPLYQYDVTIEELGSRSGEWYEVKGRARCALLMQTIVSNGGFGSNVIVWYDEQKCLYSTSQLSSPILIHGSDGQSRLNIKSLANQWSTNDIENYIAGRATEYPYDAVRILETLLKKSLQGQIQVVNNNCYFLDEVAKPVGGGFYERFGFVQSLNLAARRITLSVQTKLTTFYPEMSLLDFVHTHIGGKRVPNEYEWKKLNRALKNCSIVTQQSNWKQVFQIDQFDKRRPSEIKIESGETLIEYFKNKKNIRLVQTNYPCVQVYLPNEYDKPCHLPLEVCRIQAWQVYDKPLSKAQEAQQPRKYIPKPHERYAAIMNMLKKCDYNSRSNRLCREVGFSIDDSQMLRLNARVLTQPQIQTGLNSSANVRIGRIPLDGHLFTPKPLSALSITYFGNDIERDRNSMKVFAETLLQVMKNYHVNVQYRKHTISPTIDKITEHFHSMNEQNCQFVICVMAGRSEEDLKQLKADIKDCGTIKYGIMTQCVLLSKVATNRSLPGYCENLIRKINFKNSGINTKVNLNQALKNKKSTTDAYMFFGADVIHPTNVTRQHPSIAVVVGSCDSLCSTTAVRVCQQFPKEGKCSIETIIGMTDMVEQLLDNYRQLNKILPNKVVFYRDGVDDGQFGKIIAHEIPAIRDAFNRIYGDTDNHPKLTLIVVKKRHNTRFFNQNPSTKEVKNMSIGTVIDTTIVHPYQNNFYLNSHNAFQGVNHPSLYHVLLDEIGFTADELPLLTYHLCFTDPRSSASEAIPSVVHQADIAALKARDLFYDDERSSATSVGGRSQPLRDPQLSDLDFKILEVHENLKNRPIFG